MRAAQIHLQERQSEREGKSFGFGREQSGVRDDEEGGVVNLISLFICTTQKAAHAERLLCFLVRSYIISKASSIQPSGVFLTVASAEAAGEAEPLPGAPLMSWPVMVTASPSA